MTIANTKVVPKVAAVQIWTQDKTILVYFVGIVRYKPDTCCESILCDDISFDQLRLDHFDLFSIQCRDFLPLQLGRSRGSALKLGVEIDLVVTQSCEIRRLIYFPLFHCMKFLIRDRYRILEGAPWVLLVAVWQERVLRDVGIHKVVDLLLGNSTVGVRDWLYLGLLLLEHEHHHKLLLRLLIIVTLRGVRLHRSFLLTTAWTSCWFRLRKLT